MEENKHLEPNFSNDFNKLVIYFKKKEGKLSKSNTSKVNSTANEFFTETEREFIEI
jgi:hypothetical protein